MVLVFWGQFGPGGGGRWFLGPLLFTLAPLLLQLLGGGLLSLPLSLLGLLFGYGFSGSATWEYDPASQTWRRQGSRSQRPSPASSSGGSGGSSGGGGGDVSGTALVSAVLTSLTTMVVTAALVVVALKLFFAARRHGLRTTLRRLLTEGFWGGWDTPAWGAAVDSQRQQQQQGRRPSTRSERIERVAFLMQQLPVEVYRSREELERLPVAELKQLLKKRGLSPGRAPLEKAELVAALSQGANSTAASCTICCEDYASDDVLRVLRCGHRFHLECIDRWLLSSTDYSRPPACPLCNAELEGGDGRGHGPSDGAD